MGHSRRPEARLENRLAPRAPERVLFVDGRMEFYQLARLLDKGHVNQDVNPSVVGIWKKRDWGQSSLVNGAEIQPSKAIQNTPHISSAGA